MEVKGTHPLAEMIARKFFGAEDLAPEEIRRAVIRAARAAVEWHEMSVGKRVNKLEDVLSRWLTVDGVIYDETLVNETLNLLASRGEDT